MKRKIAVLPKKLGGGAQHANPLKTPLTLDSVDSLETLLGKQIGGSSWFVVTQERIRHFADSTNDRKWIHVDPVRTKRESPYGAPVAHGFFILSLLSQFMRKSLKIRTGVRIGINYGLNRVRFPAPVRAGNKIRARFILRSLVEIEGGFQAVFDATVEVQGADRPCCVAEWVVRYYR